MTNNVKSKAKHSSDSKSSQEINLEIKLKVRKDEFSILNKTKPRTLNVNQPK